MWRSVGTVVVLLDLAWSGTGQLRAADTQTSWLTGSALHQRLAAPLGVDWSGSPIREALAGLAKAQRVAIYLDRRVDPEQKLEAALRGVPLEEICRQVAESQGLGVTQFGPVIYFGPAEYTSRLRTLAALRAAELGELPAKSAAIFARAEPLRWPDFAEPRRLLADLGSRNGVEVAGLEQVPHDLWAGADLPALSLVDRFTLLAGQFDLTFRFAPDGQSITLVRIPETVTLLRSYPAGRQPDQLIRKWSALAPKSRIEHSGDRIVVEGLLEDHERIAAAGRPAIRSSAKLGFGDQADKRFTVRQAQGAWESLLKQLAERLDLTIKIDRKALERAGISPQQPISFSVEEATLDELLDAVLRPAGCTFRRQGNVVEVTPAK